MEAWKDAVSRARRTRSAWLAAEVRMRYGPGRRCRESRSLAEKWCACLTWQQVTVFAGKKAKDKNGFEE